MRSKYKKLGPYIRELKVRNTDGVCTDLRGVSIGKEFMPSVANVHGTDLSKYKIVERHQFAFNPMHVGRDEVLPVALLSQDEPVIVSPAYVVFEVLDQKALLPEYLTMWCRRPEFDRNAWFTTDNSVRGGFSWANFCDMDLPIPSVEKQREIVKEYQTVMDRIRLNEKLNEKLEEAAQAIFKRWFVEFDFPMTTEYARSIEKPELEGQPYKSSGGAMEYNDVLEQEIPKGWTNASLGRFGKVVTGKTPSSDSPEHFGEYMPFVTPSDFPNYFFYAILTQRSLSRTGVDALRNKVVPPFSILTTCIGSDMGKTMMTRTSCVSNQQINCVVPSKKETRGYLFHMLRSRYTELRNLAIGSSTMPLLNKTEFSALECLRPATAVAEGFQNIIEKVHSLVWFAEKESEALRAFGAVLLSRLATWDSR